MQNRVLVLDGRQDLGKSYFVRWLAGEQREYHFEGGINPDNKDSKIRLINTWIWEISELGATTKRSDREALKSFISMEKLRERLPYGHHDVDKPALANFIATVNNNDGFLNDPTGSRRFMSCTLTEINWEYADEVDVNQLWAQAKALFDDGETGRLNAEEREIANRLNAEYEMENPIDRWLDELVVVELDYFTSTKYLLTVLREVGATGSDMILCNGIKSYMNNLKFKGVKPARKRVDGSNIRGYEHVNVPEVKK